MRFVLLNDFELAVIFQKDPQIHQQLVVLLEALVRDVHLLAIVFINGIELFLQSIFHFLVLICQNTISLFDW